MARSLSVGALALHHAVGALMREAADQAILPRYRRLNLGDVSQKAVGEPVTIADRESEAILTAGLAKILPEATIVGEEAADADDGVSRRLSDRLCWIIDPLDGTGNFVAGEGPFGILIALAERGEAIGGWIYDPQSTRLIAALRGEGAMINGEPLMARASGTQPRTAAISSLLRDSDQQVRMRGALEQHFQTVTIPRCAAEQYPRIIRGVNDVTLFARTLPWDHAAGVLCLIEAGGAATRLDGSVYRVDDQRSGLVAAPSHALWEEALGYISAA